MKQSHGKQLRKGRYSKAGNFYLLTSVTCNRQPLFLDLVSARSCIQAMQYQQNVGRVESHAFVIMPDHFHWLVTLEDETPLAKIMQSVKGFSSRVMGKRTKCHGSVWQAGYHDHALRCEESLQQVARYIVANPVRAGLVDRIIDYPYWDAVWYEPPPFVGAVF